MKKSLIIALCLAIGLMAASNVLAFTGSFTSGAGINNTVHDLPRGDNGMTYSSGDSLNRICIYCHAPHNTTRLATVLDANAAGGSGPQADQVFNYLPLWNHALTTQYPNYQMYNNGPGAPQSGPHASQAMLNTMTPGSTSLLCLSCHDGSVAINAYGNVAQPATSTSSGGSVIVKHTVGQGNYLGNHHPIGFDYVLAQTQDYELRDASTALSAYSTTGTMSIGDHLFGGNMECGTCHSVHNTGNTGERLLWRSDKNSQLCLTCHAKGTYTAPDPNETSITVD